MSRVPCDGDSFQLAGLGFRTVGVIDGHVRMRITEKLSGPSRVYRVAGDLSIPLESYWALDTAAQREADADS